MAPLEERQAQERAELAARQCGEMERLRGALAGRLVRGGRGGAPDGSDLSRLRWGVKARLGQGRFAEAYDAQALVREAEARRAADCEAGALGTPEAALPCARMVAAHEEERARLEQHHRRERVEWEARARVTPAKGGAAAGVRGAIRAGGASSPVAFSFTSAAEAAEALTPGRPANAVCSPASSTTPSASAYFLRYCRGQDAELETPWTPATSTPAAAAGGAPGVPPSPSAAGTLLRCMQVDAAEAQATRAELVTQQVNENRQRELLFPKPYMPHPYLSYDGAGSEAFEELLGKLHEHGGAPPKERGPTTTPVDHTTGSDMRVAAVASRAVEGDCAPSLRLGRPFAEELLRTIVPWNDDELVASTSGRGGTTASRHRKVLEGLNRDDTALFEARPMIPEADARKNSRCHAYGRAQRASRAWDPRPDLAFEDTYDRTNIHDISGSRAQERSRRGVPSRPPAPKTRQGFQGLAGDDFDRFALSPHHRLEEALREAPAHLAAPDFDRLLREFRGYAGDWLWSPLEAFGDKGRSRAGIRPEDMARPERPLPKPIPNDPLGHRELEHFAAMRLAQLRPDAPAGGDFGQPLPPRTKAGLRPR